MIRRFLSYIKRLSLTQQLISLLLLAGVFLATFLFGYLNYNIDEFVRIQLFNDIHNDQKAVLAMYERDEKSLPMAMTNRGEVIHMLYLSDTHDLIVSSQNEYLTEELKQNISYNAQMQLDEMHDYYYQSKRITNVYAIARLNEQSMLVSLITDAQRAEIKQQLTRSIISTMLIAFSLLFIVLVLWVFYIIYSLSQLTSYVDKIQRGEDAVLDVDRKDEIGELAETLVHMNEELQRQNQAKEEMIHNISHDLKTPIATIKSYAESIKDGIYPYDSLEKSVDVIIEHAERLDNKVRNLLLLNRVNYIVTGSETGSVDLEKVIEATLLGAKVLRPEISIIKITEPSVWFGDEEPWRVVVENILDNALRYAESQITIYLDQEEFSIENDGPKMTQDRIDKLFKPFEKGTDGQFGLGLSIVYRIITAYECEICAYNTNEGVIFKIDRRKYLKKKEQQNRRKPGKNQDALL